MKRPKCVECGNPVQSKGYRKDGITRKWGTQCSTCHNRRYTPGPRPSLRQKVKAALPDVCTRCGWHEATCDLHRIDEGGTYAEDNVLVLCPNCHRVEHSEAPQAAASWGASFGGSPGGLPPSDYLDPTSWASYHPCLMASSCGAYHLPVVCWHLPCARRGEIANQLLPIPPDAEHFITSVNGLSPVPLS